MREILAKRLWLQILVVAAAYAAAGRLSLLITAPTELFGTIWPPSGIALAALLLGGSRLWPGIWLGTIATVLWTAIQRDDLVSLLPALAIGVTLGAGASLQAVVGASLVRRFTQGRNPLDRQQDVLALLFWGALVGCTVGATLGALTLVFSGFLVGSNFLFAWATWWAGDTIGTLIVAPLVLLWAERRPAWLRRRLSVTIPLAATLAIVVLLFLFATRREEEAIHTAFMERAQNFASVIHASCDDHLEALHSLTLVLSMLPSVGPRDFHTMVAGVLEHRPGIQALSWNPVVYRAGRAAFERGGDGRSGYPITERDPLGQLRPAAPRAEHVPALYIEPMADNERALGFDVASEPIRREALEQARDLGRLTATRRIRLVVQTGGAQHAVLLFSPVYSPGDPPASREERRQRLRGYATAALRMDQLVETAVKKLRPEGMTFALLDTDATGSGRVLFADSLWMQRLEEPRGLELSDRFSLGGRAWEIRVVAIRSSPSASRSWRSSIVLAAGLLFTGLLGAFLLVMTSQATQVEELVVLRTAELQRELFEHQRTGEVLRASEARYRAIFDHMIGGMITFDGESRIESVNPAAERIFGYGEDELIGCTAALLMADAPPSEPFEFLRRVHRSAIGRVTEWQGRRKNGEVFPFEVALFAFDTPAGQRYAANIQDISVRREVDRLKSEFVATVSHELRTPLTSIRGSLGLLAAGIAGELPSKSRELVRLAERNAVRLTALINDILDFESLDSSRVSMQFAAVDLQALVEQSFESVRAFADEQGISLASHPTKVRIWADAHRIVQVLDNLLANAIKFSPAGREVQVWAEEQGNRARVFVKDHGRGIPATHRERIFERFVQVEVADKRDQGGTGLGLAICKAIVEHHGGEIGVDSEVGVGSTFWFELSTMPAAVG